MRRLVFGLVILFTLTSLPAHSTVLPKPGAKCAKQGNTKTYKSKKYKCIKRGNELIWNKGISIKNSNSLGVVSSEKPFSKISQLNDYLDINLCKLKNGSGNPFVNQSFEQNPYRVSNTKPIRALIFPIDFPDLIGNSDPKVDFFQITRDVSKFFLDLSDGRSQIDWTIYPKFVRYSASVEAANLGARSATGFDAFNENAIKLAKETLDISSFDLVVYAPPLNTTRNQIAMGPAFVARDSSQINATMMDGQTYSLKNPFLILAHEIGHLMGLADLYNFDAANEGALNGSRSAFELQFKYMGIFDLMSWAQGYGKELTSWNRWLIDFIEDNQIRCLPEKETTTLLSPVEMSGGIKGAVIPISPTEAIVIESRRSLRYDTELAPISEGVLVYKVDTSIRTGAGPMRVIAKSISKDLLFRDAPLKLNESLIVDGYLIEVIESGAFGDVVRVIKRN